MGSKAASSPGYAISFASYTGRMHVRSGSRKDDVPPPEAASFGRKWTRATLLSQIREFSFPSLERLSTRRKGGRFRE
jgi:hypothetical protein